MPMTAASPNLLRLQAPPRRLPAACAAILVLVFLATSAIAFDHQLHQALHPDSGPAHECFLLTLLKGSVSLADPATPPSLLPEPPRSACLLPHPTARARADVRLAPGRAPPSEP